MSESTAAAPAIPLSTLHILLSEHCLSARAARIIEHDEHFQVLQFRSHQIYYVHNFATSTLSLPISISALARAFDCKRDRVTSALVPSLEPPETPGRHLGSAEDQERELLARIHEQASKNSPVTRCDIRQYVTSRYGFLETRGWSILSVAATLTKYANPKVHRKNSHAMRFPVVF
jgi:hypothetical protein